MKKFLFAAILVLILVFSLFSQDTSGRGKMSGVWRATLMQPNALSGWPGRIRRLGTNFGCPDEKR
jgi:hypothetical protein